VSRVSDEGQLDYLRGQCWPSVLLEQGDGAGRGGHPGTRGAHTPGRLPRRAVLYSLRVSFFNLLLGMK